MIAGNLAVLATGVFTGAAVYVSVVEHPARMDCDTNAAIAQWRPSYRRATAMQVSLLLVGMLLALSAWHSTKASAWLYGAACLGAIIPFTLIMMFPVNRRLQDENLDTSSEDAKTLLDRWGYLHAARSFLALIAFALMLTAAR